MIGKSFLHGIRVTVEPGGPGKQEQAAFLYNDWLLDMPKLLDIAVLYGRDNPQLVQQLMLKVMAHKSILKSAGQL